MLVAILLGCFACAVPATSSAAPVSAHASIHSCCTPFAFKERLFQESQAMGASYIRLDVELNDIFEPRGGPPDWRGLDEVVALARRYKVRVLAILLDLPYWLTSCPAGPKPGRCPPNDLAEYGRLAAQVAAHARGAISHWQILNEPGLSWAFTGSPEDYARMLTAGSDAIKRAVPEARIVMGNTYMDEADRGWAKRVFATAGARRKFDISGVNARWAIECCAGGLKVWRRFLAAEGIHVPVWIVEHGYPADAGFQKEPGYTDGEPAQARYLRRSLSALEAAGAAEVFVTLRHRPDDQWVSEGIIDFGAPPGYPADRLPAFSVVRDWGNAWRRWQAVYRERYVWHARHVARHREKAAGYERRAGRQRKRARAARRRERRFRRRARALRARAGRYDRCFAGTGDPSCRDGAARAQRGLATAKRQTKKAARTRRKCRRSAALLSARADAYRGQAEGDLRQMLGYASRIKPLL